MAKVVKLTECGVVCLDGSLRQGDLEILGVSLRVVKGVLNIKMPGGWEKKASNQYSFCLINPQGRKILRITQREDDPVVKVELLLRFRVCLRCIGNNGSRDLIAQIFEGERLLLTTYPRRVNGDIEEVEAELTEVVERSILTIFDPNFDGSALYCKAY